MKTQFSTSSGAKRRDTVALLASITFLGFPALPAQAAPIQFGSNYYDFISVAPSSGYGISWSDAAAQAAASTFGGVSGHLATVTSAAENNFLSSTFALAATRIQGAWLGGQVDSSGVGSWAAGPEAGQVYSYFQVAAPGAYANWGGIEPNNATSHVYMNIGATYTDPNGSIYPGQWVDDNPGFHSSTGQPAIFTDNVVGYLVEYESPTFSAPIPEPETYAMLLAGLGLLGFQARNRKRREAVAA